MSKIHTSVHQNGESSKDYPESDQTQPDIPSDTPEDDVKFLQNPMPGNNFLPFFSLIESHLKLGSGVLDLCYFENPFLELKPAVPLNPATFDPDKNITNPSFLMIFA